MMDEFDVIADYGSQVAENPLWHDGEGRLYWCSIYDGRLYRYSPNDDHHEVVHDGDEMIGGFTIQSDGSILLFLEEGAVRMWRDDEGIVETVIPPGETTEARFNDVVADPRGRVFCGTYPGDGSPGTLYRLERDSTLTPLLEDVKLSNGLGFSPDCEVLYYAESEAHCVHQFAYDAESGTLSKQETFAEITGGLPDGLTVDADGDVWVAIAFGSSVLRFAPDGTIRDRLELPTPFVSSVAFGGPSYDEFYITTGGGDDKDANGPNAGAVFRHRPDTTGKPPFRSRIAVR